MAEEKNISNYRYYPGIDGNPFSKEFIYLQNLSTHKTSKYLNVYDNAILKMKDTNLYPTNEDYEDCLKVLTSLIAHEKKAEENFLKKNNIKTKNWADLIEAINIVLGNKEVFERNINIIKNRSNEFRYVDVSKEFSDYLYKQMLNEDFLAIMEGNMNKQDWLRIVKNSFKQMYSEGFKDRVNRDIDAYKKLYELIDSLEDNNPFFEEMLNIIKEIDLYKLFFKKNPLDDSIQIEQAGPKSGKILELLEKLGLSNHFLEKDYNLVINTGGTQMKPDTAIFKNISRNGKLIPIEELKITVDKNFLDVPSEKEQSVRLRNIKRAENLFKSLSGASGDLIFISDKNYDIFGSDSPFNGFKAESPKFTALINLLSKVERSKNVLSDLMFLLINTGQNLIGNNDTVKQKIYDYLALKIAYFLFDDVLVDTENLDLNNLNIIHIFNLNNIYIPFSVLLEGFYFSFKSIQKDPNNFVNIDISAYSPSKGEKIFDAVNNKGISITKNMWEEAGQKAIENGKLTIHFFKNFIDFIKNIF